MSEVTPIGSAEGHVEIQDGHAEAVQVLVEDSLESGANKSVALVESGSAPGVEAAGLKLNNRIRCARALLFV